MPTSSLSVKRSSKLKKADLESNERVEKIVRERKAVSKLRLEAIKKKKLKEKEDETKKLKKMERLREKEALAKMKEKLDEECKEVDEIMEGIDKSSREFEAKNKELENLSKGIDNVNNNKNKDVNMVDMSQTVDSETSESESESDSDGEDDKSEENTKEKETMEESKKVTQEDHDEEETKEEIEDNENTSTNDQDKENPSDDRNQSSNQDDDNSQDTATAGNGTNRNINDALNGYTVPPPTNHAIYCKAKNQIPSSEKPTEQLRNTLGMFITTLLKVDKDFVPTQLILIDSETFFEDAKSLLDDKGNYGIYKKDIQAAETSDAGFLLFSNVYQDRERVKEAILHQCKMIYLFNPELTVVDPTQPKAAWKNGKRLKTNKDEVEIKALHVEVVSGTEVQIRTALAAMYSKQHATGPDDEKMRFIPSPESVQHSQILEKYGDIIRHQAWFSAGTVRIGCNYLININTKSDHLPKSLRKMIMVMRTTDNNPMFITLDKYWDKSVSFVFPKKYEKEARNRVADLGSYLRHKYGDRVLIRHFSPAAAARAVQSPWNAELGRSETPMNKELESIMDDCNDINWLTAPASTAPTFEIAPELHSPPPSSTHFPMMMALSNHSDNKVLPLHLVHQLHNKILKHFILSRHLG